jgi:hypothetical protein
MTHQNGVEVDCPFTPGMLKKVAYAGARARSFAEASKDLEALAEAPITAKRTERWTKRVGEERVAEVGAAAAAYQQLPLPERHASPRAQIPQVACVQMDGGRIQIRDRGAPPRSDALHSGHWRESLVGCCLSMVSEERTEDPTPTIPPTFVDPERMREMASEIKGFSSSAESVEEPPDEATSDPAGGPEVLVRSVVATRRGLDVLGPRLIAEAYARGFSAARRKAFVADGASANWSIHRKYFSHYTPILDFTHAVCYVYSAAMAGRSLSAGWSEYCRWAQWLWEGNTDALIAAVAERSEALGPPKEGDGETSPRTIVANTLRYLKNQRSRMRYAEYRRLGLPITSSHVESTIKLINRRVKGTEKFWDQGAEPILQLAADHLSETNDYSRFWTRRPSRLQPIRCYQTTA